MPKRAKKAAPIDETAQLTSLLQRCSRSSLEALLLAQFRDGDLTIGKVAAMLEPTEVVAVGASHAERVGTGAFDELDFELFAMIVSELPLPTRLTLATEVCKGWRPLRQMDHLWTRLRVHNTGRYGQTESIEVSRSGLVRLLEWVKPERVLELRFNTGEAIPVEAVKAALAQTPALRALSLTGKRVGVPVMQAAARAAFAPTLQSLALGSDVNGSVSRSAARTVDEQRCA